MRSFPFMDPHLLCTPVGRYMLASRHEEMEMKDAEPAYESVASHEQWAIYLQHEYQADNADHLTCAHMSHHMLALQCPCFNGLGAKGPVMVCLPHCGTKDREHDDGAEDGPY